MTIASLKPKRDYFERHALENDIAIAFANGAIRIPIRYNPNARGDDDLTRIPMPHRQMDYVLVLPPPKHPEWISAELALWKCAARCGLNVADAARITLGDNSPAILYEVCGHHLDGANRAIPDIAPFLETWGPHINCNDTVPTDLLGRVLAWNCAYPRFAAVEFFDLVLFAYLTGDCDAGVTDYRIHFRKWLMGYQFDGCHHFLPRKVIDPVPCADYDILVALGRSGDPAPARFHELASKLKLTEGQYEHRVKLLRESLPHFLPGALNWAKVPPELQERLTAYMSGKCAEFAQ